MSVSVRWLVAPALLACGCFSTPTPLAPGLAGSVGVPNQGVQRVIDLFGRRTRVGFYNTFAARAEADEFEPAGLAGPVAVSRDRETGEVHALRGPGFASMQFHPESVLTADGVGILREALLTVIDRMPVRQ